MKRALWVIVVLVGVVLLPGLSPVSADTIISETGPDSTNWAVGVLESGDQQDIVASWIADNSYSNVNISAKLCCGSFAGTAYLTTRIGAGTTIADQIAAADFLEVNFPANWVPLFSGLDLPPATYYLTVASPGRGSGGWTSAAPLNIVTAPGVTDHSSFVANGREIVLGYAPASAFENEFLEVQYTVTGDLAPVPEPSSLLLFGAGLLGLVGWQRKHASS